MQYDIEIGGRTRRVVVQRAGARWRVTLDGTPHLVDAATVGAATLSLLIAPDDGRPPTRSVQAVVASRPVPGDLDVHVHGRLVAATLRPAGAGRRRGGGADGAAGPQQVVAPMPGKVVRVLVAAGDAVAARQGLVVVEAMKMENELKAARAGRVVSVAVAEGQSVDAGALLAVVE
ncbi:MAG: biotin/lipoyl-containing protein [Vicinamibacterales bacterium]